MKKIMSSEDKERSQHRKKMIGGFIMMFILILSSVGFAFFSAGDSSPETQEQPVNPYGFLEIDNNGGKIYLTNYPSSISGVPVSLDRNIEYFYNSVLFVDIEDQMMLQQLSLNIQGLPVRLQPACYLSCEEDLPEKTCEDNIIVYRPGEEDKVYHENNCIFIEGGSKAFDSFIYNLVI